MQSICRSLVLSIQENYWRTGWPLLFSHGTDMATSAQDGTDNTDTSLLKKLQLVPISDADLSNKLVTE